MKKRFFLITLYLFGIMSVLLSFSYAQEGTEEAIERRLILREAKAYRKSTVAVEAYLIDNILEVKVTARMYNEKPNIYNAIVVGSKLGRLSSKTRETLLASVEEEEPYPTSKKDRGFIDFSKKSETKKAKGRLTRELIEFEIPEDKIREGKRYQLWIQIESSQKGGDYKTFKFDLEDFKEALSQ